MLTLRSASLPTAARRDLVRLPPRTLWRAQVGCQNTLTCPFIHSELSPPLGRVADVPDPDVLIRATGLTKRFGDFTAVSGIDFELRRGEAFGFLGPNGAGKSSTMRMIACVSPPSGGKLSILGMDPVADGAAIRSRLGVVPQEDTLDVELTVRENLLIYGRYFGLPTAGHRRADRPAAGLRAADRASRRQGRATVRRDEAPADDRAVADQRARDPAAWTSRRPAWIRRPGTSSGTGYSGSSSRA